MEILNLNYYLQYLLFTVSTVIYCLKKSTNLQKQL